MIVAVGFGDKETVLILSGMLRPGWTVLCLFLYFPFFRSSVATVGTLQGREHKEDPETSKLREMDTMRFSSFFFVLHLLMCVIFKV